MSSNNIPKKCNQRFKGVENFLRRIAFNLGNSPSQTEVKIISCIPIDVTDLQQKIQCLERQLEASKVKECSAGSLPNAPSTVQTALGCPHLRRAPEPCAPVCAPRPAACPPRLAACPSRPAACPPRPAACPPRQAACPPRPAACSPRPCASTLCAITQPPDYHSQNCMCWSSEEDAAVCTPECRKGFFKKQKKKEKKGKSKKNKEKTQFVYYAQTTTGPFTSLESDRRPEESPVDAMDRAYISQMIRKQYAPAPVQLDLAASEISSPVCRDTRDAPTVRQSVCSFGPFHDIDRHMPRPARAAPPALYPTCDVNERAVNSSSFYDTSLYDMIPVREQPKGISKPSYETTRRKSPNNDVYPTYLPERKRSRNRIHPYAVYHQGRAPAAPVYSRRLSTRANNKKEKQRRNSPIREIVVDKTTDTSNSCCIDCGNVYTKRLFPYNRPPVPQPVRPVVVISHKNVECLTSILNDTECQTTTTQSVQIDQGLLEEKKTEETLNQIKTILQTVLTEVKTNTQLKKVEEKPKKDAVVQKGPSQGNMPGCSTLLHSYTYSPYNMSPYMPSCSRQISTGPCCYPNVPFNTKCMHNYPVFIQTPPRHMCASCYRHSSHAAKIPARQATTTATNTESKERSKETEKLIKEIYKSMTVNMDFPAKETSASEYNEVKSTTRGSNNRSLYRASVLDEGMKKFVRANASRNCQKAATPMSSLEENLTSNTASARTQRVSTTDTERRLRTRRLENYLATVERQRRQSRIVEEREYERSPDATPSDDSSSDTDEQVVYKEPSKVVNKKPEPPISEPAKKSLFSKMFKSVKLFNAKPKKKEEQIQVDEEEDEESENSDDYQTVYSQRVERPRHVPRARGHRAKAHSKISYSRHMRGNQERSRRPYLEQEYRRHWNERLMFQESQNRYSSEGPYSRDFQRRPVYWQNYEARTALVGRRPTARPQGSPTTVIRKVAKPESPDQSSPRSNSARKGLAWLKKHKLGIKCGPQWKKFILEG